MHHAGDRRLVLDLPRQRLPEHRVVHPPEQHGVDEAHDGSPHQRGHQRRRHPQGERQADGRGTGWDRGDDRVTRDGDADDGEKRQGLLEEEVAEREAVVLVEDRERQRDGRMVADQLHPPAVRARVEAAEVRGRDGDQRQRQHPQRPPAVRLVSREHGQRHDEHAERHREDLESERRRGRIAREDGPRVEDRGHEAERVCREDHQSSMADVPRHRVHDNRGENAQCRERHRRQAHALVGDAQPGQGVGRQFPEVPGEAQHGRGQGHPVLAPRLVAAASAAAEHQHEQHGVERRAGGEAHQVEDVGRVGGGHPSILVRDGPPRPCLADEWRPQGDERPADGHGWGV